MLIVKVILYLAVSHPISWTPFKHQAANLVKPLVLVFFTWHKTLNGSKLLLGGYPLISSVGTSMTVIPGPISPGRRISGEAIIITNLVITPVRATILLITIAICSYPTVL